jgi:high-affinity iron transporter
MRRVTAVTIATACTVAFTPGAALSQDAKAIYARECAKCHGEAGAGDGSMAQKLKDRPSDWTKGAGLQGLDDAKIVESIKKGGPAIGKSKAMPAYPKLSDAEVNALVVHVKSLKK